MRTGRQGTEDVTIRVVFGSIFPFSAHTLHQLYREEMILFRRVAEEEFFSQFHLSNHPVESNLNSGHRMRFFILLKDKKLKKLYQKSSS